MTDNRIIVIGASAGGVETLVNLCGLLPSDLPAALLIVLHTPSTGTSLLPQILTRSSALPARHARHEEEVIAGHIYVAPPNHHLLYDQHRLYLSVGPRENGHRPAVDALFRSAALSAGPGVIGIILTGTLGDGAAGLAEIKRAGGTTIVQDPQESLYTSMPLAAIRGSPIDFILPLGKIAEKIVELSYQPAPEAEGKLMEPNSSDKKKPVQEPQDRVSAPDQKSGRSMLTCPECGGVLSEMEDNQVITYRCHVGHMFSEEGLAVSHANSVEAALWTAIRILEEQAALSRRLALRAQEQGFSRSEQQFRERQFEADRSATILRNLITGSAGTSPLMPGDEGQGLQPPG